MSQHEFINGLAGLQPRHRACVATIGSFDGVHLGHQVLLKQVMEKADASGLPSLAIIFEPQPYEFFSREHAPARLTRVREKALALFEQGIQRVLCLKFDQHLRNLSAKEFIELVLVDKLAIEHLIVGDDFRFGCDRAGDFHFLRECAKRYGYSVSDTHTLEVGDARVSSTRIRKLLQFDQLEQAAILLGREYSLLGRVIYGKQLGRRLGFPTANISLGRYRAPLQGVFAVVAEVMSRGEIFPAVANVGLRPTVNGVSKPLLEAHLLAETEELYGECLRVTFKQKLRSEQRFANVEYLRDQIQQDVAAARQWFLKNPI